LTCVRLFLQPSTVKIGRRVWSTSQNEKVG
jgi:hypothetical protein